MSGGSMDYLCFKIEREADQIPDIELREHAKDFADLMRACEWYLSSDTGKDDWLKAASKFKKKWFGPRAPRLKEIIEYKTSELRQELLEMIGESHDHK